MIRRWGEGFQMEGGLVAALRGGLKALTLIWAGSLLGAACAFLTQVLLARSLGPVQYGIFAAALATATLLAPLAALGVAGFWLKAFGEEGERAKRWLPASWRFIAISVSLSAGLLLLWARLGPHGDDGELALVLMSLFVLGRAAVELVSSKLQLEERFARLSLWQLMPNLSRLLLVMALIGGGLVLSAPQAAAVYAAVGLVAALLAGTQLASMSAGRSPIAKYGVAGRPLPSTLRLAALAWPFGMATMFHLIYYQSDLILVNYLASSAAAGTYGVAIALMTALYLFPSIGYSRFMLHKLHRWAHHDEAMFRRAHRLGVATMFIAGTVSMLLVWLLAPWVVPILFGKEYEAVVPLVAVLALAAPLRFVATSVGSVLMTRDLMRRKVRYMGGVALLNVGLNLLVIPRYGAMGAAATTVASEFVLLVIYFWAIRTHVFGKSCAAED